jgi:hypothetical protein
VFEVGPRTDVLVESWAEFETELAETLADLPNGGGLLLAQRVVPAWAERPLEHRPPWWRRAILRLKQPGGWDASTSEPYVQFLRNYHHLVVETCAPSDLGGRINLSAQQETELRDLGWADPRAKGNRKISHGNFAAYYPNEGVPSRVLSETDPERGSKVVEWEYTKLIDFTEPARLTSLTLRGPLRIREPRELWVERSNGWRHRD